MIKILVTNRPILVLFLLFALFERMLMNYLTQPPLLHFIAAFVSLLYITGIAIANIEGQLREARYSK